jgi:hypothetical protein
MRQIRRWSNSMEISSFEDLLRAARAQPEPQRLLFVFAKAELPDDSTPEQRACFQAGKGGALIPLMSVDKAPEELDTFAALAAESREFGQDWAIVFVAGLSGRGGRAPTSAEADQSLQRMIEAIKTGAFGSFVPFDRQGNPMLID